MSEDKDRELLFSFLGEFKRLIEDLTTFSKEVKLENISMKDILLNDELRDKITKFLFDKGLENPTAFFMLSMLQLTEKKIREKATENE